VCRHRTAVIVPHDHQGAERPTGQQYGGGAEQQAGEAAMPTRAEDQK
jgi:hypothetical protein